MKDNVVVSEDEVRIYPRTAHIRNKRFATIVVTLAILLSNATSHSRSFQGVWKWTVLAAILGLGIWEVYKSFHPEPLCRIDRRGILDRITAFGVGWIGWDEVLEVKIFKSMKTEFVGVYLKDPQGFAARLHYWKRIFQTMNVKSGYPPVALYPVPLGMTAQELMELIGKFKKPQGCI